MIEKMMRKNVRTLLASIASTLSLRVATAYRGRSEAWLGLRGRRRSSSARQTHGRWRWVSTHHVPEESRELEDNDRGGQDDPGRQIRFVATMARADKDTQRTGAQ